MCGYHDSKWDSLLAPELRAEGTGLGDETPIPAPAEDVRTDAECGGGARDSAFLTGPQVVLTGHSRGVAEPMQRTAMVAVQTDLGPQPLLPWMKDKGARCS